LTETNIDKSLTACNNSAV